jgi:3-hydroxybutyryl-CoA dehydrogenase
VNVTVIGAGTMGSGIAQLCATAGHQTQLVDVSRRQLEQAGASIAASLGRFVRKQTIDAQTAEAVTARITGGTDLAAAVREAGVVIETVVEILEVKQAVFTEVVSSAPPNAVLGTNTSQLSITRIASGIPDAAARVAGIHFFNPPVLMKLVEVIAGLQTDPATIDQAVAFAQSLGRETVVCRKDSPGFLTSRISAIVRLECLRMLEEGVASAADIDKALRLGFNWPMGPLELGDFNGLDTYLHVLRSLEAELGDRFKPTITLTNLVAAGRLGRKTGYGIYRYDSSGARIAE